MVSHAEAAEAIKVVKIKGCKYVTVACGVFNVLATYLYDADDKNVLKQYVNAAPQEKLDYEVFYRKDLDNVLASREKDVDLLDIEVTGFYPNRIKIDSNDDIFEVDHKKIEDDVKDKCNSMPWFMQKIIIARLIKKEHDRMLTISKAQKYLGDVFDMSDMK